MLMRYLPIVLAVACVTALLLLYERMQPQTHAPAQAQTHSIALAIANGHRAAGPAEIETFAGDRLLLSVTADRPAELHLHGYDKTLDVAPGRPTTLDLLLEHSGRFELEAHGEDDHHGALTVVNVKPR